MQLLPKAQYAAIVRLPVDGGVTLGRNPTCRITSLHVSRSQCVVERVPGRPGIAKVTANKRTSVRCSSGNAVVLQPGQSAEVGW
jgi:hypothetical protein